MARKPNNYWKKRFEAIEAASNAYGQGVYKQIEETFIQAQRELQAAIDTWYTRIAVNNQVSILDAKKMLSAKELAEFKWDVKEYIKYGKENAINQQWMKQLENASAKFHISRLEALKIQTQQVMEKAFGNELDSIDTMARRVYTDDYYHTAFEIQKGFNIGWDISSVDNKKLEKLISKPWAADGKNFSDRVWQSKTSMVNELHNELVRTCILGKPPDEAIKRMTKFVDKKFNNAKMQAGRLVMTEQAFFASAAQKDCFQDLDVEEYEVVATLDSHTSEICEQMDGKHFPMKEYQPGVTAPPFHVWCRTTTVPWFADNYGERAARDDKGKTYYVPSDMNYKQWKGYNDAIEHEPQITNDLKKIIKTSDSNLEGLEFRLKSPESFIRKVNNDLLNNPNLDYVISHTYDVVRYTNVASAKSFTSNYNEVVYKLAKQGYNISRVKNTLSDAKAIYRGLNAIVTSPSGFNFELQFHTPESFAIKQKLHTIYEKVRLPSTPHAERIKLNKQMTAMSSEIVTPDGCETILNYNGLR